MGCAVQAGGQLIRLSAVLADIIRARSSKPTHGSLSPRTPSLALSQLLPCSHLVEWQTLPICSKARVSAFLGKSFTGSPEILTDHAGNGNIPLQIPIQNRPSVLNRTTHLVQSLPSSLDLGSARPDCSRLLLQVTSFLLVLVGRMASMGSEMGWMR